LVPSAVNSKVAMSPTMVEAVERALAKAPSERLSSAGLLARMIAGD
jgi:hypothetical protein